MRKRINSFPVIHFMQTIFDFEILCTIRNGTGDFIGFSNSQEVEYNVYVQNGGLYWLIRNLTVR